MSHDLGKLTGMTNAEIELHNLIVRKKAFLARRNDPKNRFIQHVIDEKITQIEAQIRAAQAKSGIDGLLTR